MMFQATLEQAVGGQPAQLRAAAGRLRSAAGQLGQRLSAIDRTVRASGGIWSGRAGDAYRAKLTAQLRPLRDRIEDLTTAAAACDELADRLDAAKAAMLAAVNRLRALGISEWYAMPALGLGNAREAMDLQAGRPFGNPDQVAAPAPTAYPTADGGIWVLQYSPMFVAVVLWWRGLSGPDLQPMFDAAAAAFRAAINARLDFIRRMGGIRERLSSVIVPDRTPAELAEDRLVMLDRRGDLGTQLQRIGGQADMQGRLLLYRWGNPYRAGALRVEHGSDLSNYLMHSGSMQGVVRDDVVPDIARDLVTRYPNGSSAATFDHRDNATLPDNGYWTGLEQLHSTNRRAGDFHARGTSTVVPDGAGGYRITLDAAYTWNDVMDPNHAYRADTVAAGVYGGKPYDVHINWNASTEVVVDPSGAVRIVGGYAAPRVPAGRP